MAAIISQLITYNAGIAFVTDSSLLASTTRGFCLFFSLSPKVRMSCSHLIDTKQVKQVKATV